MQSTRSVLKRRSLQFLLVLTLPLVFLLAAARADAATEKLPDLEQQVPKQVQIGGGSGGWQIGFLSEVVNRGSGPLEIHGHRSGTSGNMTADQIIYMSDGTKQTVGGVGDLHYETGFGPRHWHFEPFDHYELRTLAGSLIGTDEKEGFCLGDNNNHGGGSAVYGATVEPTFCQQNNPSALSLTEGISPGWGDSYDPLKEGQDVPITQSSSPTGDYNLVHRVNENSNGSHAGVQEASFGNNVASAEIHLSWSNGKPTISVLKTCMGTSPLRPRAPSAASASAAATRRRQPARRRQHAEGHGRHDRAQPRPPEEQPRALRRPQRVRLRHLQRALHVHRAGHDLRARPRPGDAHGQDHHRAQPRAALEDQHAPHAQGEGADPPRAGAPQTRANPRDDDRDRRGGQRRHEEAHAEARPLDIAEEVQAQVVQQRQRLRVQRRQLVGEEQHAHRHQDHAGHDRDHAVVVAEEAEHAGHA